MSTTSMHALSQEERARLRETVARASEPIPPFWPMQIMVAQNPMHGLEYLPFDEAVRKGKHLLGGNGYLPNAEYRQFYRSGRITSDNLTRALARVRPPQEESRVVTVGSRGITADEVWFLHVAFGFEALEPALLAWELGGDGATKRFREDLPGDSRQRIIERTLEECEQCRDHPEEAYLTNLWKATLSALGLSGEHEAGVSDEPRDSVDVALPAQRTISDWVDVLAGTTLVEQVNGQLIKWLAAFVDEGLAGWEMPGRHGGFYAAWRELAPHDQSGRFLGIRGFEQKVNDLPTEPEDAMVSSLHRLGVPEEQWSDYLARQLSQLPGWTRYVRWLETNPAYHAQRKHPVDAVQYLAVRLFYESELTQSACEREWGIDGTVSALVAYWREHPDAYEHGMGLGDHAVDATTQAVCRDGWRLFHLAQVLELSPVEMSDLASDDARTLLGWLDAFPPDRHGPVWLEAYEEGFRGEIVRKLSAHRGTVPPLDTRPRAQLVFCIDVRSESFRRHVEAQGPYETFGFAGFFGIPLSHQAFDSEERAALCPVLLSPKHAVTEIPRLGEEQAVQQYATGTRWHQLGHHVFHDLKHHPVGSMMLIDVLGFFFSLGLLGKTLIPKAFHAIQSKFQGWSDAAVPTRVAVAAPPDPGNPQWAETKSEGIPAGLAQGFSLAERATFIETGLRVMGLTLNYSRLVVLCGHGSQTDNNPYFAALDCGACGGNHGDANARVFAAMANEPEVRRILNENGLPVPEDTWFLPAKHNTTTDRVTFYDLDDIPDSHREDLQVLSRDLEQAGMTQALERCQRIPSAPDNISPQRAFVHVEERSRDWANPRPEWGLAGNAAFLIGRRRLTKGLDLGGRVFLHSYDPLADPEGANLERIMTAPLIVGEWINTGYYFSSVDPWHYGSGSKVIHNVVSGVGVMLGSQSDLQIGFPLQTVNDGDVHYHEPMRLLGMIEAPPSRISSIIRKHAILQQLFHNQWLNLVALDPHTFEFHRYHTDATWELIG